MGKVALAQHLGFTVGAPAVVPRKVPTVNSSRRLPARSWLVPVAVAILVLAATACGSSSGSTASGPSGSAGGSGGPVTVRLGYFPNITHAPALVGVQKGFFKDKLGSLGTLETKTYNAGSDALNAMLADAVDISYIGPNPSINGYQKSNGEAVRIVAGSTSGGAEFVVKPDINSAVDLKGKTVASPQLGNTQDVALRTWLKSQGLNTDTSGGGDVSIKPQDNGDTLNAFKAGDIAGAWVPEPWGTRLVQEGGGKVLVDEKTLWPDGKFVTTNILVSKKFLDAHPDAVKAILDAHLEALDYIKSNPDDAQKLANAEIKNVTQKALTDPVIQASWKNMDFTADPLASTLAKNASDAQAIGQLKSTDIKNIYDLTLLNQLLQAKNQPPVKGLST
jgi:NitT/TauT family transport system substrate-binding protein